MICIMEATLNRLNFPVIKKWALGHIHLKMCSYNILNRKKRICGSAVDTNEIFYSQIPYGSLIWVQILVPFES